MSAPMYLSGDKYALGNSGDGTIELDCGYDCGWTGEVNCSEDYSHGMVYYHAEFVCPNCGEENTRDGEYEDSDY